MSYLNFFKRTLTVLGLILIVVVLWNIRSIFMLAFTSAVIAIAIHIPMHRLQLRGWSRPLALTAALALAGLVNLMLIFYIIPSLITGTVDVLDEIPQSFEKAKVIYSDWWSSNRAVQALLPDPSGNISEKQLNAEGLKESIVWLGEAGLAVAPKVFDGFGTFFGLLVNLGLIMFVSLFFLLDPKEYIKGLVYLFPQPLHKRVVEIVNELYITVNKWLTVQFLSVTIIILGVWLILGVFLGMPKAFVVASFAGLATFIPNIGAVLPVVPIVIFTLAYGDPSKIPLYVGGYLLIQGTESNIITPSVVKSEMAIPAALVMLFQLVVTMALGALGLVLAVPLLAVIIALVRETFSYDLLKLKYVEVTIGEDPKGGFSIKSKPMEPPGSIEEPSKEET